MSSGTSQSAGKVFAGRLLCGVGIFLAVIGAFFISVALNALGIVLGMVGYTLGARWLGPATVIFAILTLLVGLLLGQGVVPGAYDRITDGLVN